jgi:hypothetical protein
VSAAIEAVSAPPFAQRLLGSEKTAVCGAALMGGIAWSGAPGALGLALLAPAVILSGASRRAVAARALAYFAAATWPIVPSAAVFFGDGGSTLQLLPAAVAGWALIAVANAAPWALLSPRRPACRVVSLLLGLLLPALPPLALIGLASPLAGLGALLPGTGIVGALAYTIVAIKWVGTRGPQRIGAVAVLLGLAVLAHATPSSENRAGPRWQGVSTTLGTPEPVAPRIGDRDAIERLRRTLGHTSADHVVLPESAFRDWRTSTDAFLEPLWRRLKADRRTVLFGVQRLNPATGHQESLLLVRGATRGEVSQHYPVPVSMYRFGAPGSAPLRWREPYALPVGEERVAVLICWEQLLLAPMLSVLLESPSPTRLVAVSNLYFARGTPVARIQQAAVASWAQLLGVPHVYASNE